MPRQANDSGQPASRVEFPPETPRRWWAVSCQIVQSVVGYCPPPISRSAWATTRLLASTRCKLNVMRRSIGFVACQAIQTGSVVPGETWIVDPHAGASGGVPAATRFKPYVKANVIARHHHIMFGSKPFRKHQALGCFLDQCIPGNSHRRTGFVSNNPGVARRSHCIQTRFLNRQVFGNSARPHLESLRHSHSTHAKTVGEPWARSRHRRPRMHPAG